MTNDSIVKILTKFLKTWIWHLKTCVPMTKNLTTRQENMHGVVELDCSPTLMYIWNASHPLTGICPVVHFRNLPTWQMTLQSQDWRPNTSPLKTEPKKGSTLPQGTDNQEKTVTLHVHIWNQSPTREAPKTFQCKISTIKTCCKGYWPLLSVNWLCWTCQAPCRSKSHHAQWVHKKSDGRQPNDFSFANRSWDSSSINDNRFIHKTISWTSNWDPKHTQLLKDTLNKITSVLQCINLCSISRASNHSWCLENQQIGNDNWQDQ